MISKYSQLVIVEYLVPHEDMSSRTHYQDISSSTYNL